MEQDNSQPSYSLILKGLCILIILLMVAAVIYTAWLSISYYNHIGV